MIANAVFMFMNAHSINFRHNILKLIIAAWVVGLLVPPQWLTPPTRPGPWLQSYSQIIPMALWCGSQIVQTIHDI